MARENIFQVWSFLQRLQSKIARSHKRSHVCGSVLPSDLNKGYSPKHKEKYHPTYSPRVPRGSRKSWDFKWVCPGPHKFPCTHTDKYTRVFALYQSSSNPSFHQGETGQIKSSIAMQYNNLQFQNIEIDHCPTTAMEDQILSFSDASSIGICWYCYKWVSIHHFVCILM